MPYDIPLKNIQDMAYGTSEITTYGIFKMTYGVIKAWLDVGSAGGGQVLARLWRVGRSSFNRIQGSEGCVCNL